MSGSGSPLRADGEKSVVSLNEAQRSLQERARRLAREVIEPRAAAVDATEEYPWHNVEALTAAGFMGLTVPAEYGGPGGSCLDAVLVIEELAQVCATTARIMVEGNLGAIGAIMAYGSEEQKELAAKSVLAGDKPAICITEPGAGSAATDMTTRADRRGARFVINGRKHWITGGGVSRLHLIFARVFENDSPRGIGAFIAFRGQDGLRVVGREPTLGIRGCPEAELLFEDLVVPEELALVPPGGYATGFASLMKAYNGQRLGAATVALGIAEGAFRAACQRVREREQFGRPIYEFQGVQWILADMSIQLTAARCLVRTAAANAGQGFPDTADTARAKIFAAETANKVVSDALQLFGAAGYSRRFPLERMFRDARMFTIGGGTTQVLRNLVASSVLGRKLPQRRGGYLPPPSGDDASRTIHPQIAGEPGV
jgi:alkylation response protein AidB-like acyl-CoA dehydrogenase